MRILLVLDVSAAPVIIRCSMTDELDEGVRMTTPLEDAVLESFVDALRGEEVSESILEGLSSAFNTERLPAVDSMVELIKSNSGGKLA